MELCIYHFNARFYSPKLGRFLNADTLMSGFANPQNLNRFSYVANNPVRYTDPTGHMLCAFCDGGGDFPDSTPPTDEPEPPVTDPKTDPEPSVDPKADDPITSTETQTNSGDDQDTSILRWPDYYTLNIATGWPLAVAGVDIQVTIDRYGNVYGGLGGYGGTPGVTVFGGWLLQTDQPNEQEVESFVGQSSFFGGGGYWGGGSVTWGRPFDGEFNWNDLAVEAGFSTPGGAGGYTYSWLLYDNGDPTPIIWQGDQ